MKTRIMEIDDLPQVMKIEEESFSVPWTENGFFTFLIRDDTIFVVAEENEEILGYCGIVCVTYEGDITNVAVKESCRGQGIGKAIVKTLIEKAYERGVRKIYLEVRRSNASAIGLYEGFGFKKIGVRKEYYELPVEDAFVMELDL